MLFICTTSYGGNVRRVLNVIINKIHNQLELIISLLPPILCINPLFPSFKGFTEF